MCEADAIEMVVSPVRWRIVLTMAALMPVGAVVGLVLARFIYGDWDTNLAFTLACYLVAGLVVGLIHAWRQQRSILLNATELQAPAAWGGMRRLPRDEIDLEASGHRSRLDVVLLRDVVRSRQGESLSLYHWSYSSRDLRRLQEVLGISVRGDGRGV